MNKVDAMNTKLKIKRARNKFFRDKDEAFYNAVLSMDIASIPRRLTFFDVFSEVHSVPEDVDSVKLFYADKGRLEDRRQIRKYFKRATSDLGMSEARFR